jgi:hypothetical protein
VANTLLTFRVYLASSPDTDAERAHLHQHVFPALGRHWEQRGVRLEVVDLRRTPGHGGPGLELALTEIERCRPWFMALLSQRLGPVLTAIPPGALDRFPWLRQADPTSLLELEIVQGFLLNENPPRPGLFYFRDPEFLAGMPPEQRRNDVEENPQAAARLAELKEVLAGSPQALVRLYECRWNPELQCVSLAGRFGHQVFADLSQAIEIELGMQGRAGTGFPPVTPKHFAPPLPPSAEPYLETRPLASGSSDRTVRAWDTQTAAPAGRPEPPAAPAAAPPPVAAPASVPAEAPGIGGFGEVFQAAAPPDRAVVLKMIPADTETLAAEARAVSERPLYVDENVQFTVYRPRVVQPRRWYPLLAFAHLAERRPDAPADEPDPVAEVYRQAREVLGKQAKDYHDVTQDSRAAVPREGEITFVPEVPGVEFNPPRRTFLWQESVHREEFRLRAAPDLDGKTVRGRLTVFLGTLILADVSLSIKVDSSARPAEEEPAQPASARPYRRIFASYSHRDLHVVQQVEHFTRAMGDEYLRDWTHLRAGEVWNDRLRHLIEQADVFQLFWSSNSMQSPYVRQEWEHALSLGRPNFIRPVYWEEPLPTSSDGSLPPEELRRIHFQKLYVEAMSHPPMAQAEPEAARRELELAYVLGDVEQGERQLQARQKELSAAAPTPPPAPAPVAAAPPPPRPADAPDWRSMPPPTRGAPAKAREEQADDREERARRRAAESRSAPPPPARASVPPLPVSVTPSLSRPDEEMAEEEDEAQARMPAREFLAKYRMRRSPWFLAILVLLGLAGLAFLLWRFLF